MEVCGSSAGKIRLRGVIGTSFSQQSCKAAPLVVQAVHWAGRLSSGRAWRGCVHCGTQQDCSLVQVGEDGVLTSLQQWEEQECGEAPVVRLLDLARAELTESGDRDWLLDCTAQVPGCSPLAAVLCSPGQRPPVTY